MSVTRGYVDSRTPLHKITVDSADPATTSAPLGMIWERVEAGNPGFWFFTESGWVSVLDGAGGPYLPLAGGTMTGAAAMTWAAAPAGGNIVGATGIPVRVIGGPGATNDIGGDASLRGGAGNGSGVGGPVDVTGGKGGATAAGGEAAVVGGAGGTTSGAGGEAGLLGGVAGGGNSEGGAARVRGGSGRGTEAGGAVEATGGAGGASGTGGAVAITGGVGGSTSGAGGAVSVAGGNASGTAVLAAGGGVTIAGGESAGTGVGSEAGSVQIIGGEARGAGTGGDVTIFAGATTGGTAGRVAIVASDGSTNRFRVNDTGVGFFNASPIAQPAAIPDPAGGGTVDTQARDAINDILAALRLYGLIAT